MTPRMKNETDQEYARRLAIAAEQAAWDAEHDDDEPEYDSPEYQALAR